GASAPLNRRLCARVMSAANRRWRWVKMKSPGTKSAASAPRPYRSAVAIRSSGYGVKSDVREDLLGKPRDHAALKRIRQVDDEVLDPHVGVALDDASDAVGVPVQRVPRANERLVLAGAAGCIRHHTVDLAALAQNRVELERLQHRVVIAADRLTMLAKHLQLVAHGLHVGVEVARVPVLSDELQGHLLASTTDPDRRVRLLHRLRLVDRAAHAVVAAVEGGVLLCPHRRDHLERLAQHPEALGGVRVLVAVRLVLMLVPAGADAEDEAAATHHVDAAGHLREQGRRPVAVAG